MSQSQINFRLPDLMEDLKDRLSRIVDAGSNDTIPVWEWEGVVKAAEALADATRPIPYHRLQETAHTIKKLVEEAGGLIAADGPIDDYHDLDAWEYRHNIQKRVFQLLTIVMAVFDGYFAGFEDGSRYSEAVYRGIRVKHPDLG